MARITLVTGGCRSGKSAFAEKLACARPGKRAYIATCPVLDDEMRRRVDVHRQRRAAGGWTTIEEQVDLSAALRQAGDSETVLVDCLTLWVNNLMYHADSGMGILPMSPTGILPVSGDGETSTSRTTHGRDAHGTHGQDARATLDEPAIERICNGVLSACGDLAGDVIFVTNEIGMGIVPDNALARRYRDLAGRCNQTFAAASSAVVLVVSGIPLYLKGG
jgi:adenosylcobinamide kinase / adenosylcobinamide-phosphate guanylyltransferase